VTDDTDDVDDFPFADHFREGKARAKAELDLSPGDIYEDCAFHPVVCVEVDYDHDEIRGVSLVDGTYPRACSLRFCGVRKLGIAEAWEIRRNGPSDPEDRVRIQEERRWWRA
jgi:hypothetical protein